MGGQILDHPVQGEKIGRKLTICSYFLRYSKKLDFSYVLCVHFPENVGVRKYFPNHSGAGVRRFFQYFLEFEKVLRVWGANINSIIPKNPLVFVFAA